LTLSQAYEGFGCQTKEMRRTRKKNGEIIMLDKVVEA
jgi:hypothetical protein